MKYIITEQQKNMLINDGILNSPSYRTLKSQFFQEDDKDDFGAEAKNLYQIPRSNIFVPTIPKDKDKLADMLVMAAKKDSLTMTMTEIQMELMSLREFIKQHGQTRPGNRSQAGHGVWAFPSNVAHRLIRVFNYRLDDMTGWEPSQSFRNRSPVG